MKQSLLKLFVLIIVISQIGFAVPERAAADPSIWAPPELARLIEEGLTNNKDIQSIEAQVAALKEKISFEGALDDPRIGIGILNLPTDTYNFDQEPMTQKQLFIAQKIPWFGKLSLKSQRAALAAIRQDGVLEAKRLELARRIAVTHYQLGFISSSLEINDRLNKIVSQLLRVAETRYATGRGLQQDVLQAQVELSKLLDEKITLEKQDRILQDRINELLNRESFIKVNPPGGLGFPGLKLKIKDLQTRSLKYNPWLRVRQAEIDSAKVNVELARKDYWPDADFKLAYGRRDEDRNGRELSDFVSASVVMNIPLWHKSRQDKNLEAAKNSRKAALKSYRNLVESLPHQVDSLATEIHRNQDNYRLYADALVTQARQWALSALSAYEVGSLEFDTMINAHVRLLRFELQTHNYLFTIYQKRSELEEVLGGPLNIRYDGDKRPQEKP